MATTIASRSEQIASAVCVLLAEHLRAVIKYGPDYARRYVEAAMNSPSNGTAREARLHPDLAHLIRELAQDELTFERRASAPRRIA